MFSLIFRSIVSCSFLIFQTINAAIEPTVLDTPTGYHPSLTKIWSEQDIPLTTEISHAGVGVGVGVGTGVGTTTPQRWLLSLDGGGVRGLIQLYTLAEFERKTGRSVPEMFDAISGTSIGGIIACLLTIPDPKNPTKPKYSASTLLKIFQERLGEFFVKKWQSCGGLFRTRYKTSSVQNVLNDLLQNNHFKDRLIPVVLVTHDLNINEERLIATTDDEDFITSHVAMATGAAPTYFKPQHVFPINGDHSHRGYILSDGGTCMNNPTLPGLALMYASYGTLPSDVNVLSLGTGTPSTSQMKPMLMRGGILKWGRSIADTCIAGQSSAANHLTRTYCGDRYHRLNPVLALEQMGIDDASERNQDALFAATRHMRTENKAEIRTITAALKEKAGTVVT